MVGFLSWLGFGGWDDCFFVGGGGLGGDSGGLAGGSSGEGGGGLDGGW